MFWSLLVVGFGLNAPLRQYFSLYRAVCQRDGEIIDETTTTRTYYKRRRPFPYYNLNQQDGQAVEVNPAPSHHPTTPLTIAIFMYTLYSIFYRTPGCTVYM